MTTRELREAPSVTTSRRDHAVDAGAEAISVIVPLVEERQNAEEYHRQYAPALRALGRPVEFVFVRAAGRDGLSSDVDPGSAGVRVIDVGRPVGHATMLKLALDRSEGGIVVILPPSFRVAPDDLPRLVRQVDLGSDMAVAWRRPQKRGWFRRLQSASASLVLNTLTGTGFHDATCRTYAMRREVLADLPLYGGYFRFLPILADHEGFRVDEVEVRPHATERQPSLYSPSLYLGWLIDSLGLFFLLRFTYRPLRFFGLMGAGLGVAGGVILGVLLVQRLGGQGIANRPLLVLGVLLVTLGAQSIALGLIGEIVVHFQAFRSPTYRLARPPESSVDEPMENP
ncbi:MAG: hypothetical protein ACREK7_04270 [Gemmatimonadota bacterium]